MRTLIISMLFCFGSLSMMAQSQAEAALAERYYIDGEYESALDLFLKVNRQQPQEKYGLRIVGCYEALTQYETGLEFLNKELKKKRAPVLYSVVKAGLLEKMGQIKEADNLYEEVIQDQLTTQGDFIKVGAFLRQNGKLALAKDAYLQGRKNERDPYLFSNEVADLHGRLGEFGEAAAEYLNLYFDKPMDLNSSKMAILNLVNPSSQEAIEKSLLRALDKKQTDLGLRTILYEFYVQAENFFEAFVQVKSIDRLFREEGERVFNFAETMRNSKDYGMSNRSLDYIIDRKKNSPYYYRAHLEKAVNGELKAFDQLPVDMPSVLQAVTDYGLLLDEFGREPAYFDAIYRRARLMVFYLNQLDEGRQELEQIVARKQALRLQDWAEAKLLIGDILLIQQDYNKAKLTYTEVSDVFKDRQIGAMAKYRLGQLAYYKGEFKLAQALLGAIKDNTSNDISNDAIKLNLLIMDNSGLDTTTTALEQFAQAQLLNYQRQYKESLTLLDTLAYAFPDHQLADEILWEKTQIFLNQNDIQTALTYIDRILNNFPEDIYGDDALYTKARLHDYSLKDPEAAMQHYLDFLAKYPGSLFSVEVRKRIRELRKAG
ncbi:MAG: tetratricopeptide repeat protein [Bacteroidota bacterium]